MDVAQLAAFTVAQPASLAGVGADRCRAQGHDRDGTITAVVPSRQQVFVGAVLALGILAMVMALSVVPAPWIGWLR